jgi:catechol 2,3-dioxygenase-like lactoylglutathione lyase family enzyme
MTGGKGMNGVGLFVEDMKKMVSFYCDVLKFETEWDGGLFASFKKGNDRLFMYDRKDFAKAIGELEGLDESTQKVLEVAAVTHDIGIKLSEKMYKSAGWNYQQIEGPPEAKKLLAGMGFDPALIERVCWLIAHHHIYDSIGEADYQILVEADFLVNAFEGNLSSDSIESFQAKVFKTGAGIRFMKNLYRK